MDIYFKELWSNSLHFTSVALGAWVALLLWQQASVDKKQKA